ncbi:GlxA family transcriptional regulator [Pendulispora brunnea]|uniref:GlxA family transcriptional regulator n=1 Tax=Pendulispora brunnea TaxID=2905690 RepID=A0ABZ2KG42_9BACT
MQRVAFIVAPDFQVMSFAALSVFEFANVSADAPLYDVRVLSETGGPVRSSMGVSIETRRFRTPASFDTIIVGGSMDIVPASPAVLSFVRKAMKSARRVASICTGAFILAEAGVLDGRRVTTHWFGARDLQARFPKVKMDEDRIFIVDGPIWTSAGASAGIDLALGMVEEDLGPEVARAVAKKLVVYHRRAGGQSQHSVLLELEPKTDRIQNVLTYAKRNLRAPLSVRQLAKVAHLSPRQFSRAFRAETGRPPAKAIEDLRVEAARIMMERGQDSIDMVARESGFTGREHMRRAFLRAFGQPPQAIRRNTRGEAASGD